MNLFMSLPLPLPEVLRIIDRENDKTRVYFVYIPNMNLIEEQSRHPKGKAYFNEVIKHLRVNLDWYLQELDPKDRMDIYEDNDTEYTNSRKNIDIIGHTPNKLNFPINGYDDFDDVSLESHGDSSNNDAKIESLDRIPTHVRWIKDLLSNKEKL